MDISGLENVFLNLEEALKNLDGYLEDRMHMQEDPADSSAASGRTTTDATREGSGHNNRVVSRQKRTNIYPFYIVRNIITFIQITLVLTRKLIVVGQYLYNRINMREGM